MEAIPRAHRRLVGGTHSFMYVVGETLAPSYVTLELPAGWSIATALTPTSDPRTFSAPSTFVLVESPMLVGRLRDWRFAVDAVPHRVVYWSLPDAVPFDSTAVVAAIERLAREARALFGRLPYREYVYQLQDGAYGALEHPGVRDVRRAESRAGAKGCARSSGSWRTSTSTPGTSCAFGPWSTATCRIGRRHAHGACGSAKGSRCSTRTSCVGVPVCRWARRRASRTSRRLIARYLSNPGNGRLSAERVSEAEYGDDPGGARRLLGQHPPPGRADRGDDGPRDPARDERPPVDGRRDAPHDRALFRRAWIHETRRRARDRRGVWVHGVAILRRARAGRQADSLRRLSAVHRAPRRRDLAARVRPTMAARCRIFARSRTTSVTEPGSRLTISDPSSAWGKSGVAHRRPPSRDERPADRRARRNARRASAAEVGRYGSRRGRARRCASIGHRRHGAVRSPIRSAARGRIAHGRAARVARAVGNRSAVTRTA